MSSTNFGEGIFDNPVSELDDDAPDQIEEKIELTDREIAIARGEDPDEIKSGPEENPADEEEQIEEDEEIEEGTETEEPKNDGPQWSNSDLMLAGKYGFTDEDLADFGSAAAMHRAIIVLDRKLASGDGGGESRGAEPEDHAASEESAPGSFPGLELLDLSKYEDYEPEDRALAEHLNQTKLVVKEVKEELSKVSKVVEMYEQQTAQQRQEAAAKTLNSILSKHPEIYGDNPGKITKAQADARKAVAEQAEIIYSGYVAKGTEVPDLDTIFDKAIMATHGAQLPKRELTAEQRQAKLKKQSNMRRSPGSKASTQQRTQIDRDDPVSIDNSKEVVEMFNRFQVENGVA
jgi:hypothetical protein